MNREYSILILGAGIMQCPAIKAAKKKNWTVIVADGNPDAPGKALADHFEHIDLKNWEDMIIMAEKYREKGALDGVFTAGTDFSLTVARVAERLRLPGISVEAAEKASDKSLMRETFQKASVQSPRYLGFSFDEAVKAECIEDILQGMPFPLVVKPVDNMGARGIRRVDTCIELKEAIHTAGTYSRCGKIIVEEYVDGPEYSVDALVYEGEITVCRFADRHIRFSPYFVEMGHTIPSNGEPEIIEKLISVFHDGIRALGIDNGAAKGDIKWDGHRAVVGEIAARLSGGYMSGWTFPYSSGTDLTGAALNIALGLPPGDLTPRFCRTSAERAFISIPGKVSSVENLEEASSISRVRDLFVRSESGSSVKFPRNNVEKCGNVISSAEKRDDAVESAEKACRAVIIRLEPCDPATESFLFRGKEEWIPDAFGIYAPENREILEKMETLYGSYSLNVPNASAPFHLEAAVVSLPGLELEGSCDWHGESLETGFRKVIETAEAQTIAFSENLSDYAAGQNRIILGKLFWDAFTRGGIQGGIWIIDTVRTILSQVDLKYPSGPSDNDERVILNLIRSWMVQRKC